MSPQTVFRLLLSLAVMTGLASMALSYALRAQLSPPLREFLRVREQVALEIGLGRQQLEPLALDVVEDADPRPLDHLAQAEAQRLPTATQVGARLGQIQGRQRAVRGPGAGSAGVRYRPGRRR